MGARVLLVCTANICRSPAAERLLAGRLGPSIEFVSRGTRSVPGAGMCEVAAGWVLMNGGDASGSDGRVSPCGATIETARKSPFGTDNVMKGSMV